MARGHPGLPAAQERTLSRQYLLGLLQKIDNDQSRKDRVLRLETSFLSRVKAHICALPDQDARFHKFNTNPYVLLIHACQRGYSKISDLEADILPAKQFSSMETSAGRMVEEVVLPEYGWECVASEMHTPNSALDGKRIDSDVYHLATLKSGPRCLNDEMSENLADAIIGNCSSWSGESGCKRIDFTYGVLYGTQRLSNKKDWHILRNIKQKCGPALKISPCGKWTCQFVQNDITVDVTVRIGLDWWQHLGGDLCFIEVFTALIRACVRAGAGDADSYQYTISDLHEIVATGCVSEQYNVSLLQRSQLPWLFLMARHFCDELLD